MRLFRFVAVVLGWLSGTALAGYSSYFYSAPAPLPVPSFVRHQPFFQPQPLAYSTVRQPLQYSSVPQTFGFPIVPQFFGGGHFYSFQHHGDFQDAGAEKGEVQDTIEVQGRSDAATSTPATTTTTTEKPVVEEATPQISTFNYQARSSDGFRGFAYHTEMDHGARSDVIFITGPEAHKYQFPTPQEHNQAPSHTPASDAFDSNAIKDDTESIEVGSTSQVPSNSPISALVRFLENPQVGVQKFYSIDNNIVARRIEDDYPGYPASTLPLQQPISPIFTLLQNNFNRNGPVVSNRKAEQREVFSTRFAADSLNADRPIFSSRITDLSEPEGAASEEKLNTLQLSSSTTVAPITAPSNAAPSTAAPSNVAPPNAAPSNTAPSNAAPSNTAPTNTAPSNTAPPSTTTTTEAVLSSTTEPATTIKSTMAPIIVEDISDDKKERR